MRIKEFIKPTLLKILAFLLIGIFYLFIAKEDACAVGFFFKLCYEARGFPFAYLVSGDVNSASDYIATLPLGKYFMKTGNFLINPLAFALDIAFIYLLSCLLAVLFRNINTGIDIFKKQ